jgi:hypothetical protein
MKSAGDLKYRMASNPISKSDATGAAADRFSRAGILSALHDGSEKPVLEDENAVPVAAELPCSRGRHAISMENPAKNRRKL